MRQARRITLVLLFFMAAAAFAAGPACAVCRKEIKGKYLTSEGKAYCSEKCFGTTRPKCDACNKPCLRGVYTFMGKNYCSEACRAVKMRCSNCGTSKNGSYKMVSGGYGEEMLLCEKCAGAPVCFACSLPRRGRNLADGRFVCDKCAAASVSDPGELAAVFRKVRSDLAAYYGFDAKHAIGFKQASLPELEEAAKGSYSPGEGSRMAVMNYRYDLVERESGGRKTFSIRNEQCSVAALNNVPRELLIDAVAHELAHDFLRHNAGRIADPQLEEGFCEAVAADYNRRRGQEILNLRKERNPDPVYGGGYRKMRDFMTKHGFDATVKMLKSKGVMPLDEARKSGH